MGFSDEEKLDMFTTYIKCNNNKRLSASEYRRTFPGRAVPSANTFRNVYNMLRRHKSLKRQKRQVVEAEDVSFDILLYFQGNCLL